MSVRQKLSRWDKVFFLSFVVLTERYGTWNDSELEEFRVTVTSAKEVSRDDELSLVSKLSQDTSQKKKNSKKKNKKKKFIIS